VSVTVDVNTPEQQDTKYAACDLETGEYVLYAETLKEGLEDVESNLRFVSNTGLTTLQGTVVGTYADITPLYIRLPKGTIIDIRIVVE
jgi:hypothetical protein